MSVNLIVALFAILLAVATRTDTPKERKLWLSAVAVAAGLLMTSWWWIMAVLVLVQVCWSDKFGRFDQVPWAEVCLLTALFAVSRIARPFVVSEIAATATKLEYRNSSALHGEDMKFVRAQASGGVVHLVLQERVPDLMGSILVGLTLGKNEELFEQIMGGFVNKTFCDSWARWLGIESRLVLLNLGSPIYQADIDAICP